MGIGNNTASNQIDNLNAQFDLNKRTSKIVTDMQGLAEEVRNGAKGERLQQIQLLMQDLQRDLEVMKQMEESMKKAMESINKFPQ